MVGTNGWINIDIVCPIRRATSRSLVSGMGSLHLLLDLVNHSLARLHSTSIWWIDWFRRFLINSLYGELNRHLVSWGKNNLVRIPAGRLLWIRPRINMHRRLFFVKILSDILFVPVITRSRMYWVSVNKTWIDFFSILINIDNRAVLLCVNDFGGGSFDDYILSLSLMRCVYSLSFFCLFNITTHRLRVMDWKVIGCLALTITVIVIVNNDKLLRVGACINTRPSPFPCTHVRIMRRHY